CWMHRRASRRRTASQPTTWRSSSRTSSACSMRWAAICVADVTRPRAGAAPSPLSCGRSLMTSTPEELASAARELAVAALHEITPASTVGPIAGYTVEESGALSLRFENRLPGYPGWYWTVSVAQLEDAEPTVLEAELMPEIGRAACRESAES